MIEGSKIKKLKVIPDERGRLMEILRAGDELFVQFGQVYMTTVYPGVVKAWHYHKNQTDNMTIIKGMMKIVLCDLRENSKTYKEINEYFVGEHNPMLIQIPKEVYHGFKCISTEEAICVNCPDKMYNYEKPDEYRLPFDSKEIDYNWERKNG